MTRDTAVVKREPVIRWFPDDARPSSWRAPVVAVGNFDGVHRGHLKILERVRELADARRTAALVLTFDPHPPRVVRPDKAPPLLMTPTQKYDALVGAGADGIAVVRFSAEMARWDAETFVRRVVVEWLRAAEVCVGANFLFGHDRTGTFSTLRAFGAQFGFNAEAVDAVRYRDFVVSSTRIRRLILDGRVDEASVLLGHHYALDGHVVHGDARGRLLGFPTANLSTQNELLPAHGVYLTLARLDEATRVGVTNVGMRPTFGGAASPSIETHLLDLSEDVYDKPLRLSFVQRIRGEQAFADVDALRAQIRLDVERARDLSRHISL